MSLRQSFIEVSALIHPDAVEGVTEILLSLGAKGVAEEVGVHGPAPTATRLSAYFPEDGRTQERVAAVEQRLEDLRAAGVEVGVGFVAVRVVEEVEWGELWRVHFHAQRISPNLIIVPSWEEYQPKPDEHVIVLDPGHGGTDHGTRSATKRSEKEFTLDVAKRVEQHLAGSGARVYLTRRSDTTMSLEARNRYAADRRASLFVSIHFNAAVSSARGIETFCLPPVGASSTASDRVRSSDRQPQTANRFDAENVWLAHLIQKSLRQATGAADRGVRRARFQVLRDATCPAALVECGFLSNSSEAKRIYTTTYRDTLAKGIAEAILEYKKSTE